MLNPGETIERYEVVEVIGTGGHATVYRLRHTTLQSEHAIKVLNVLGGDIRARLLREGRIQASLRHPNIVPVTDVLDVNGQPALLMPYVDGPDLAIWLERHHPVPLETVVDIFRSVVEAIEEAHNAGLVHRDLKPANIMMARAGDRWRPKVTDFGIAKIVDGRDGAVRTRTGIGMGTPAYMAPEQIIDAANVDHRADIFALGCILYELIVGQRLNTGNHPLQIVAELSSPTPIDLGTLCRPVSPALMHVLDRCLQKDRNERFPDCRRLLQSLDGHRKWVPPPTPEGPSPALPRVSDTLIPEADLTPLAPLVAPEGPTAPDSQDSDPLPLSPPATSRPWSSPIGIGVVSLLGALALWAYFDAPTESAPTRPPALQPIPPAPTSEPAPSAPEVQGATPGPDATAVPEPARSPDSEPASAHSATPTEPTPSASPQPATSGTAPSTAPQTPPSRSARVRPASDSTVPNADGQTGTLDVNSLPWAHISVDGAQRGRTWQKSLTLSVGSHELVLRTSDEREYRTTVAIPEAGAVARICWDFDLEESCLR